MLCLRSSIAAVLLALTAGLLVSPAAAQGSDEDWQLLNRIFDASNSVSPTTAREAQAKCVAIGREIDARPDMIEMQRLTLQAEVESCIAYAMNNGQYSDETGDQCSHHMAFARLLTASIQAAQGVEGVSKEQFEEARYRLQGAVQRGPQMGCSGDYAALLASLPAEDAIASNERPGLPDQELMGKFEQLKYGIIADGPEQWLTLCRTLRAEVDQRGPSFHEVERLYFVAQAEDCVARTMALSGFIDETGTACTHHHAFAQNLSQALRADKDTPFFEDGFRQFMENELITAMRQGPGMGCTEDYAGLAVE